MASLACGGPTSLMWSLWGGARAGGGGPPFTSTARRSTTRQCRPTCSDVSGGPVSWAIDWCSCLCDQCSGAGVICTNPTDRTTSTVAPPDPLLPAESTLAAPESHAQVRAQQDRNPLLNRALDTPAMRSPRWAEQAAASAPDRAVSWPRPAGAAPAGAAAAAPSLSSPAGVALEAPVADPALQRAADALGRDSTATPAATMDRYAAMLAQPSMVGGLG